MGRKRSERCGGVQVHRRWRQAHDQYQQVLDILHTHTGWTKKKLDYDIARCASLPCVLRTSLCLPGLQSCL